MICFPALFFFIFTFYLFTDLPNNLSLLIISYHTSSSEVSALSNCLNSLPPHISYAVIVNDYKDGAPIDQLEKDAELFVRVKEI